MNAGIAVPAAGAFDALAERYDEIFTDSLVGRAQRAAVWRVADRVFRPGMHVLELNCGTGVDARHFAARGIRVTACDASPRMVELCRRAARGESTGLVDCRWLATEQIANLQGLRFHAAFSNFSGLNCVADLAAVARDLGALLPAGAPALLCFSTRVCAWEFAWFGARAHFRRATRRWNGQARPEVAGHSVPVWYATVRGLRRRFAPWFELRSVHGIGVAVPPSYAESWARRHRRLYSALRRIDRVAAGLPLLRALGDHVLLEFRRTA